MTIFPKAQKAVTKTAAEVKQIVSTSAVVAIAALIISVIAIVIAIVR